MSTTGQQRRAKHEFIWDGRGERGDDARYSIIPGRAADDMSLTAIHFRLLAFMGRFNQKKGWCRLNQSELAERLGVRRGSLNRAVAELVEQRYIEKRSQQESRESFCLYRVVIDERDVGDCAKEAAQQPAEQQGPSLTVS